MGSTAPTTWQVFLEAKLVTAITTGTTTGITIKVKQVNGATPTWPTAAHRIKIVQKTATVVKVEKLGIAAGTTQSGQTVTLGTATRALSLSDGTSFAGGAGTAQSFAAGADVFIAWDNQAAAEAAMTDLDNTFTGTNTFSGPFITSGSLKVPVYATTTARDVAIPSPSNGMIVYITADGVMNQYIAGAWTTFATGSVSNASTTVAGKEENATVAEQAAHTATGGTGATLVPVVGNLVTLGADGTAISGAIPTLNTSVALDRTIGGLGTATGTTAYTLIANGTTATGPTQNLASAGSATQILTSNGASSLPTFQDPASQVFAKARALATTISGTLTNPTTATAFDNLTYTIPANDLIAGTIYEVEAVIIFTRGTAGVVRFGLALGGTEQQKASFASTTGSNTFCHFRGFILGTATGGASVAVRTAVAATNDIPQFAAETATNNCATNGTLALTVTATFGTSDGGNNAILRYGTIKKISTVAF